jgi:hypothetical protein
MAGTYRDAGHANSEVKEILDCYEGIAGKIAVFPRSQDLTHTVGPMRNHGGDQQLLLQAIKNGERRETLYQLCFTTTGDFGSEALQPALPLAVRNDWSEVVGAILGMKANPNSRDR